MGPSVAMSSPGMPARKVYVHGYKVAVSKLHVETLKKHLPYSAGRPPMEKSDEPSMVALKMGYTPTRSAPGRKVIGIGDVDAFGSPQQALVCVAADDDVVTIIACRLYTGKPHNQSAGIVGGGGMLLVPSGSILPGWSYCQFIDRLITTFSICDYYLTISTWREASSIFGWQNWAGCCLFQERYNPCTYILRSCDPRESFPKQICPSPSDTVPMTGSMPFT